MIEYVVFHLAFITQIVVGSYYIPRQYRKRVLKVIELYPKSDYPKLYPGTEVQYRTATERLITINDVVFALGMIMVGMVIHFDYDSQEKISEAVPAVFFMIQGIPYVLLELSEFSYFKQMRSLDVSKVKSASMKPRRLLDFVSPWLLYSTIACFFISIVIDFYVSAGASFAELTWSHDTVIRGLTLLAVNLLFSFIIYMNIYGKKCDPHLSGGDRNKVAKTAVKTLCIISIFASVFFTIQATINDSEHEDLIALFLCLYNIGIISVATLGRLSAIKLDELNFDVYKGNSASV